MTVESTEHLQRRVNTYHVFALTGPTVPFSEVIYHRLPSSDYGILPHPAQVIDVWLKKKSLRGHTRGRTCKKNRSQH
jgi:hypothetical protein